MKTALVWLGLGLVVASVTGCGEGDKDGTTSSGGTSSSSSGSTTSGDTDAGAETTESAPKAAGPKIVSVMKMTGSLHVAWELPEKCDGVEVERKDGDGAFEVKFELPGTVDNKHDGTATEDMVYTYRTRCTVGADYTEYSNEMGKNPTQ